MSAYLKFGKIKGESKTKGHEGKDGWMEIASVQWGCGRNITTRVGSSSKREASSPSINEITISKLMDSTSPLLAQEALVGKAEDAEIHLTETGSNELEVFLKVTLENCMISTYSMASGGDRPSETMTLNFTKIEYHYQGYDDKHKADTGKKQVITYDLAAAKV